MANNNQISEQLEEQGLANLLQNVAAIKSELQFLINLTTIERRNIQKMGDKSVSFVQQSLEYAKANPHLVPPYLDLAEFEKDMLLYEDLAKILRPLRSLVEGIDDTMMKVGNESYLAALTFYKSIKVAKGMNIAGTTNIYEDLKAKLPKGRKKGSINKKNTSKE